MSTTVRTRAARSAHITLASGLAFGLTLSLGTLTITTAKADLAPEATPNHITSHMGKFKTYWQPDTFDSTDHDTTPTLEPTTEPITKNPTPTSTAPTGGEKQYPGANPSSSKNYGTLANTGADVLYFVPAAALLLIGGGTIIAIAQRKAANDQ